MNKKKKNKLNDKVSIPIPVIDKMLIADSHINNTFVPDLHLNHTDVPDLQYNNITVPDSCNSLSNTYVPDLQLNNTTVPDLRNMPSNFTNLPSNFTHLSSNFTHIPVSNSDFNVLLNSHKLKCIFLSKLDPSFTSEALELYIKHKLNINSFKIEKMRNRKNDDKYASFKLFVLDDYFACLNDPKFWLQGMVVHEFKERNSFPKIKTSLLRRI